MLEQEREKELKKVFPHLRRTFFTLSLAASCTAEAAVSLAASKTFSFKVGAAFLSEAEVAGPESPHFIDGKF
jgi:hypothetical protein